MDNQNVIDISNDLQSLEDDLALWLNMSFNERKRSDEICLDKYGCTNVELYNQLKSNLLSNMPEIPSDNIRLENYIIEGGFKKKKHKHSTLSSKSIFDRVSSSKFIMSHDNNIVIITDFIDDDKADYDLSTLNTLYDKYLGLSDNQRDLSDDYSVMIWGSNVPSMYHYMKNKILTQKAEEEEGFDPEFIHSLSDNDLTNYNDTLNEAVVNDDKLELCVRRIDCYAGTQSIYESSVLESFADETVKTDEFNYSKVMPYIVPYLSYNEFAEFNKDNKSSFEYVFDIDQKTYFNTVRELLFKFRAGETDAEQKLLEMGWNPHVDLNGVTIKFARDKQIKYFNQFQNVDIVDISKYTTELDDDVLKEAENSDDTEVAPLYIVLTYTNSPLGRIIRKVRKSTYSHAGIAFEPTLQKVYSFNYHPDKNVDGFSVESLDGYKDQNGDAKIKVLVLFVTKEAKERVKFIIKWFEDHADRTKYSFANLFKVVLNKTEDIQYNTKMVCSQFVDTVLKLAKIDITNTPSNLVAPDTFEKMTRVDTKSATVISVWEGMKSKYNWKAVRNKVSALMRMGTFRNKELVTVTEAVKMLFEYKIENLDIMTNDSRINSILEDMRKMLTPTSIVQEVKSPIGFTGKGDMYISMPRDLQAEYNEAHKLLYMYDQSNVQGIKHELARLFYLNSLIERKLKKFKDNKSKEYKDLIDLRARILNDFTTYFKVVKTIEPNFDFMEYMKSSEYYNKTLVIDDSTLKYSGSYIKKAIQAMLVK